MRLQHQWLNLAGLAEMILIHDALKVNAYVGCLASPGFFHYLPSCCFKSRNPEKVCGGGGAGLGG